MDAPDSGRNSLTSEVSTAPALSGKEWDGFAVLDEEIIYRSATAAHPTTIPSPSPHSPMKASEGASSDTSSATFDAAPPAPPPSLRGSAQQSSEDDEVAALSSLWREMRIQSSELSASLRMAAQGIDEIDALNTTLASSIDAARAAAAPPPPSPGAVPNDMGKRGRSESSGLPQLQEAMLHPRKQPSEPSPPSPVAAAAVPPAADAAAAAAADGGSLSVAELLALVEKERGAHAAFREELAANSAALARLQQQNTTLREQLAQLRAAADAADAARRRG